MVGAAFAQGVQADPGDHGGQPRVEVVDSVGPGAAAVQPQPRFLHRVLGVVDRTQHPVGDGAELGPGRLEALR